MKPVWTISAIAILTVAVIAWRISQRDHGDDHDEQ